MVTSGHLPELPEVGEVTPQLATPRCRAGYTSENCRVTGVAPRLWISAAIEGVKLRTFMPFRSSRVLIGWLQ